MRRSMKKAVAKMRQNSAMRREAHDMLENAIENGDKPVVTRILKSNILTNPLKHYFLTAVEHGQLDIAAEFFAHGFKVTGSTLKFACVDLALTRFEVQFLIDNTDQDEFLRSSVPKIALYDYLMFRYDDAREFHRQCSHVLPVFLHVVKMTKIGRMQLNGYWSKLGPNEEKGLLDDELNLHRQNIDLEVLKMAKTNVGRSRINFDQLLRVPNLVLDHSDMTLMFSEDLVYDEFRYYRVLIKSELEKFEKQLEIIEQASKVFHLLHEGVKNCPSLLLDCVLKILGYVSDEDRRNVITAAQLPGT